MRDGQEQEQHHRQLQKKSRVGRGVLQAIRLVDPSDGIVRKKSAADRTARRKFGLAM